MIPFLSDLTAEDKERADKLVEFYFGSYDNITESNAQALIDMFSDSGKLSVIFCLNNINIDNSELPLI